MNHLIVDGFGLAFHANFAFDARTSSGMPSGCVYGFLSMLAPWKKRFQDHHVTVAWDSGAVRKKEIYASYKSERPQFSIGDQVADIMAALKCLNVTQAKCVGEEADDVIGTLVKMYAGDGQICLYTADKDLMQLVKDGKVTMIRPRSGQNEEKFYDEEAVRNKFGVGVDNVACFLAFRGDTVDSIPGLPRVRSTIIARLVEKYRTPEGLYAGLKDEKLTDFERKSFTDFEAQAKVNFALTTLATDLPLEVTVGKSDDQRFATYLDKYEIKRIASESYARVFDNDSSFNNRINNMPSLFDMENQ